MPLTSSSYCPSCENLIVLSKQHGVFVCPICHCEFGHNFRKWSIGIPVAVVLALSLWQFLHLDGLAVATIATIATAFIIRRMPTYKITIPGKRLRPEDALVVPPRPKESRWFLALLFFMVAAILVILVWSIWGSM